MEERFKLKQYGTSMRTEIIAGLTTFFTMSYILMVNPGMFSDLADAFGVSFGAIYIATALSAAIGTFLIGILSNLPLAQASGMGLNAFFVYTVCFGLGFTYANALIFVLVDGVIFVILTATGLRRIIFDAIPKPIKQAIPVGIGLFIAFLGFQDSGIVVASESTGVDLASFNLLGSATPLDVMPKIITILTLVAIIVLAHKKKPVPGAVLWSIIGGTIVYYICNAILGGETGLSMMSVGDSFSEFANISLGTIFKEGFDFSAYLDSHTVAELIIAFITTSLAFCMVDMFDTMGTLYGACKSGGLLVKNDKTGEEEVPNMNRAMLADAIATCVGAVFGTSTVTTYVESASGVGAGGRTRLTSYTTAICFVIAVFLSPIASLVPACAYSAALIYVGSLMFIGVIDWDKTEMVSVIVGFITAIVMPFTYNISYGICFGLLSYVLIKLFTGKAKEINVATWIITVLFVAMIFTAR